MASLYIRSMGFPLIKPDPNKTARRALIELYAVCRASIERRETRSGSDPLHTGQYSESPHEDPARLLYRFYMRPNMDML
jgi:hypothetical protein